jgi:hypothetical protein
VKIENTTDIPTSTLREIFDFVKPNNLPTSKFTIWVTYTSKDMYSGIIYPGRLIQLGGKMVADLFSLPHIFKKEDYSRTHIVVRVTKNENVFPYLMTYKKSEKLESWSFPNSLDPKYADPVAPKDM